MKRSSGNSKRSYTGIIAGAAIVAALATTAGATYYLTREPEKTTVVVREVSGNGQQIARADCDDRNIVGTLAGAAVGGILGSNVGGGTGKTAATIGGTLGGAYVGNKYIPANGATCS